jgi:hypothetical protein
MLPDFFSVAAVKSGKNIFLLFDLKRFLITIYYVLCNNNLMKQNDCLVRRNLFSE